MTLLVWIVRLLVALMILRAVVRLFAAPKPVRSGTKPARTVERSGGTLVRDPHCGTYIPQSKAIAISSSAGATTFFCSIGCRDAWAAAHRR